MSPNRDQLLDAALATLNRHPTASMAEIATAIGSSRATLHRHFASREALLAEIAERGLDRWERTQDESGIDAAAATGDPEAIRTALDAMLRQYVADADQFGIALTDEYINTIPALLERCEAIVAREVAFYAAAQAAGVLRTDVTAAWIAEVVFGLSVSARNAIRWESVARRDLPGFVVTTFLQGAGR